MTDIKALDDTELEQMRADVEAEQKSRQKRADLAEQIRSLAEQYVAAGGDMADLWPEPDADVEPDPEPA